MDSNELYQTIADIKADIKELTDDLWRQERALDALAEAAGYEIHRAPSVSKSKKEEEE